MPFGLIFGAVFFLGICGWLGARLAFGSGAPERLAGVCLALLGAAVALGLVQRRQWARWAGALFGVVLAGTGLRLAGSGVGLGGNVLLLSSIAATALLLVPATGDPRRMPHPAGPPRTSRGVALWAASFALAGLAGSAWWSSDRAPAQAAALASGELPAAAVARKARWVDFGSGLERARQENKPILATFVTDWCPYCTKMRSTWDEPAVAERLEGVVFVRVDGDESRPRNGFAGQELVQRYGVQGYPAQILFDGEGRILARHDGYQTTSQLLSWLDTALGEAGLHAPLGLRSATR